MTTKTWLPEFGTVLARRIPGVVFLTKSQPYPQPGSAVVATAFNLYTPICRSAKMDLGVGLRRRRTGPRTCPPGLILETNPTSPEAGAEVLHLQDMVPSEEKNKPNN